MGHLSYHTQFTIHTVAVESSTYSDTSQDEWPDRQQPELLEFLKASQVYGYSEVWTFIHEKILETGAEI